MAEKGHVVGIGLTLMDAKTWVKDCLPLPNGDNLLTMLDTKTTFVYSLGGVVPNILTAYSRFTGDSVSLIGCVGNDKRGIEYQRLLDPRLGELQVHQTNPTGVVAQVLNNDGSVVDKKSFYGAACNVQASSDLCQNNLPTYFITNATVFSIPEVVDEVHKAFTYSSKQKNRLFVLNCGGARPNRTTRDFLFNSLQELQMNPDIAVGNEAEMCYLAGVSSPEEAISTVFPQSRIAILTRAEKGSIIRFEGKNIVIPAYPVNPQETLDSIGMGDGYMGVWLGALSHIPSNKWRINDIYKAACTASHAASSIMMQTTTQLSKNNAESARRFFNEFKSQ